MGNYSYALEPIARLFGDEVIIAPPITKKTIDLGAKHSPESACVPFKYNLGNYIEALELGANILIQAGGGCRFGYYGEVQEEILKDLGYDFEFLKLSNNYFGAIKEIFISKKKGVSYLEIVKCLALSFWRLRCIDKIEFLIRANIGFEVSEGEHEKVSKEFFSALEKTSSIKDVKRVERNYKKRIKEIETKRPEDLIRVALVGELYILMEPFSNFYIEKKLAKKGVRVYRFVTLSSILHDAFSFGFHGKKFLKQAHPYLKFHIGSHGTESVGRAHKLIKDGFDGIIHVKPFGCMPEVNAMSALHKLSKEYKVPIVYFSFDAHTSETGIKTRIEAFYDMLKMKKNKINN